MATGVGNFLSGGAFGDILGGLSSLFGDKDASWFKSTLIDALNRLQTGADFGQGIATNNWANILPQLGQAAGVSLGQMFGSPDGTWGGAGNTLADQIMAQYGNVLPTIAAGGQYMTPEMQEVFNRSVSTAGSLYPGIDYAQSILGQGGFSPERLAAMQTAQGYANGTAPGMGNMLDAGQALTGYGGATGYTMNLQDIASELLGSRGWSNDLRGAQDWTNALIQTGGQTAGTQLGQQGAANLLDFGTGMLGAGGATPTTDALQNLGITFAGRDALLSPEQAMSMARDQAATSGKQQAEAAYRRALARGGGPGAVVGSGIQNQAMADYADQLMANEAKAGQDAMTQQQALGLQQQGLGQQMATSGANLAQSNMGLGANLAQAGIGSLGNLSGQEQNTLLSALGLTPTINTSVSGNLSTAGNLGLSALQQELARATGGAGILSNYGQLGQAGLSQLSNLLSGGESNAINAGNLLNALSTGQGNQWNQFIQNQLSAGKLGLDQANSILSNQNAALNTGLGQANNWLQWFQTGANPQANMAGQGLNLYGNMIGAIPGLWNQGTASAMRGSTGNILGGATQIASGLGSLLTGKP